MRLVHWRYGEAVVPNSQASAERRSRGASRLVCGRCVIDFRSRLPTWLLGVTAPLTGGLAPFRYLGVRCLGVAGAGLSLRRKPRKQSVVEPRTGVSLVPRSNPGHPAVAVRPRVRAKSPRRVDGNSLV